MLQTVGWTGGCVADCGVREAVVLQTVGVNRRLCCRLWGWTGGCVADCGRREAVVLQTVGVDRRLYCRLWGCTGDLRGLGGSER